MKMNNSSKNNAFMKNNLSKLFIFIGLFMMMFLLNGLFVNALLIDGSSASVGDQCTSDLVIAGYCRAAGSCAISTYGGRSCSTDNTYISAAGACTTAGCDYGDITSICGATCTLGVDTFYGDCGGRFGSSCDSDAYGGFVQDGLCAKTYGNDQYGSCVTSFVCNNSGYIVTTSACNVAAPCDETLTNGDFSKTGVACLGSCVGSSGSNCCSTADCNNNKYCDFKTNVCICGASTETVCDGLDDDCDGSIDEGLSAPPASRDSDSDGYPGTLKVGFIGCAIPAGFAADSMGTDCDETNANVHPNAAEIVADGIDQNCDGKDTCYTDADNDGYGINTEIVGTSLNCITDVNRAAVIGDCNDNPATYGYTQYPGNVEVCDGRDNDCDGSIDEGFNVGSSCGSCGGVNFCSNGVAVCSVSTPSNWNQACDGTDTDLCNEGVWTCAGTCSDVTSSATEVCDSVDNDCDGFVDEGCDDDRDGFVDSSMTCSGSFTNDGYASGSGSTYTCSGHTDDCDDNSGSCIGMACSGTNIANCGYSTPCNWNPSSANSYPDATEICDTRDNNCDGTADNLVPNSRPCDISHGVGIQSIYCSGSPVAVTYGTCTVVSCLLGYTSCANACNANVVDCTASIPNAASATKTGSCTSNVWDAGSCNLISCTSDYKRSLDGKTCIPKTKCGDGAIQDPNDYSTKEICDINAFNGVVCSSLVSPNPRGMKFNGGTLACNMCTAYDTALCTYCGDNVIQTGEECDNGGSNGDNAACRTDCKHNCYITNVIITPSTGCYGYNCHEGDKLSVKIDYSSQCSLTDVAANKIQIDFSDPTGTCVIQGDSIHMPGITQMGTLSGTSTTFDYTVPAISFTDCSGKGLTGISATIRNAADSILTPNDAAYPLHIYSNKANTPITPIVMSTSCEGYVQYNTSKNFTEFKQFSVPSTGVITYVCDGNNPRVAVNTALPAKHFKSPTITSGGYTLPVCFDSYTVKGAYTTQTIASATQFCVEKNQGYISGTFADDGASVVSTKNPCWLWKNGVWAKDTSYTNKTIKCMTYSPSASSNNGEEWVVQILGTVTDTNFMCSSISDGVCPNDFSSTLLCDPANGYNDVDCGAHEFVKCLPVIDVDGQDTGNNTCANQAIDNIEPDSWCAIQKLPVPVTLEKMHAPCVGGAVVQDPTTGCPKCLMPGEEVVYPGINKSVPTRDNPLNIETENMTLVVKTDESGGYVTCPAKKYNLDFDGAVYRCIPDNIKCDEGYRSLTTNTLQFGCDKPANFTNGKWILNTACLYKVGSQYTTYCGLNSWYKNYEIYDDQFKIIVR